MAVITPCFKRIKIILFIKEICQKSFNEIILVYRGNIMEIVSGFCAIHRQKSKSLEFIFQQTYQKRFYLYKDASLPNEL